MVFICMLAETTFALVDVRLHMQLARSTARFTLHLLSV